MKLGIDAGTYSIKLVVLGDDNKVLKKMEKVHHNNVKDTFAKMVDELGLKGEYKISVTGAYAHALNTEKTCVVDIKDVLREGLRASGRESMLYIGESSAFYLEKDNEIIELNNPSIILGNVFLYASDKMNLSLEALSEAVTDARAVLNISGRELSFAKHDIDKYLESGEKNGSIILGLCYSLIRNCKQNLTGDKKIKTPMLLCGGVMKNPGIIKAVKSVYKLDSKDILLNAYSIYLAAAGVARLAEKVEAIENVLSMSKKESYVLPCLPALLEVKSDECMGKIANSGYMPGKKAYLGIDAGNSLVKLALISSDKELIYKSVVDCKEKRLDTVLNELTKMHQKVHGLGRPIIAVTGCKREEIGKAVHASMVIDDISALSKCILDNYKNADTIIDIGKINSSLILIRHGKIKDFDINRISDRGLGEFFDGFLDRFMLSVVEFDELALKSENPCKFKADTLTGIENDINASVAYKCYLEDICAGLALAIAEFFVKKIASLKKIGNCCIFSGDMAGSKSVISAFCAVTKSNIFTDEYADIFSAVGAASLLIDKKQIRKDADFNKKEYYRVKSEFDDACMAVCDKTKNEYKKKIALPRAAFFNRCLPLLQSVLNQAGYEVVVSENTDKETLGKIKKELISDTDFTSKIIYGQLLSLVNQKPDYLLVPSKYYIMDTEKKLGLSGKGISLITIDIPDEASKKAFNNSIYGMMESLGISKLKHHHILSKAYKFAEENNDKFDSIALADNDSEEPVFVIVSEELNIYDSVLGLGIEEWLYEKGYRVINLSNIEAKNSRDYSWPYGQSILPLLDIIKESVRHYPIYISNFGSHNADILNFLQNEMDGRRYLYLEADDYSDMTEVNTKLEAFLHMIYSRA